MGKIILGLVTVLGLSAQVFASCPDISGSYQASPQAFVGYEQTDCQFLKRYFGQVIEDGTISFIFEKQFKNGSALCSKSGACETVTFTPDAVVFDLNFNGNVLTDEHGRCSHRGYSLSKDKDGNLVGAYSVFACKDGFQGKVKKVFSK